MTLSIPAKFTLSIKLGNAAMQTHFDVASALREIADELEHQIDDSSIIDDNGESVGEWTLVHEEILIACPCCAGWIANRDLSGCDYEHDDHADTIRTVGTFERPVVGEPIGETLLNNEEYICDYCQTEQFAHYGELPYPLIDLEG